MTGLQQRERNLTEEADFTRLTSEIASAYVTKNRVSPGDLPALIEKVHRALTGAVSPAAPEPLGGRAAPTRAEIRRSIRPDHLVSFEDGKPYKTLARHLSSLGLTPNS
jgi:predicted transcriptional regulator